MNAIKDFIKKITGGDISGAMNAAQNAGSSFGVGGFGDISEIVSILSEKTGLDLSQLTDLATHVDTNLLGNIAQLAQGKIDVNSDEGKGVINSVVSQVKESEYASKLTEVIHALPIPEDIKSKIDLS